MPPPTLAETAAELEAQAEKLLAEGKHELAAKLALAACAAWRAWGAAQRLPPGNYSPRIGTMDVEHKAAISMGRASRKAGPMLKAARAKGFKTMKELAAALGVGTSFLSQAVNGAGGKKMPPALAEKLRELIGWEP